LETGATALPQVATRVIGMLTRPKRPGRVSMAPEHGTRAWYPRHFHGSHRFSSTDHTGI